MSLLDSLLDVTANPDNYTDTDRYREYRQVFLGSQAGERVLRDILLKTGYSFPGAVMQGAEARPPTPDEALWQGGARDVGYSIMRTLAIEPKE